MSSATASANFKLPPDQAAPTSAHISFTDLGMFSAGDYVFSVAGLPLNNTFNIFNHASNDDDGGVPADGADDRFAFFLGGANAPALTLIAFGNAAVPGFFEKSSDINVQVYATPVPLPAALPLLMAALGGLGLVARRRRKVV